MGINSITTPIAGGQSGGYPDGWQSVGEPATLAPAGGDETDAAAITAFFTVVTGADSSAGVILPDLEPGATLEIFTATASETLFVYPPAGQTINAESANSPIEMDAETLAKFRKVSATTWGVLYTAA